MFCCGCDLIDYFVLVGFIGVSVAVAFSSTLCCTSDEFVVCLGVFLGLRHGWSLPAVGLCVVEFWVCLEGWFDGWGG